VTFNLRAFLNTGFLLGCIIFCVRMLRDEFVDHSAEQAERTYADQLADILYTPSDRMGNFAAFGLEPSQGSAAIAKLERYEKKYRNKVRALIRDAEEDNSSEIVATFCLHSTELRPRYAAVKYLIKESNKKRQVIDLRRASMIEEQPWAGSVSIDYIYKELELRADPKANSATMFAAAMLTGSEDLLVQRIEPWGEGGSWKWSGVLKEHKEVEAEVVEYLALMHLFVEVAMASDGICE
jgi:hypothetical protein